jgi:hypothetical protein
MLEFLDVLLEFFSGTIFKYILSPVFKLTSVSFRWFFNFGQITFAELWEKPKNILYGFLIWITAIIGIMLYFIFKK